MRSLTIPKGINTIDTFQVKGEDFVVLKKDYIEELVTLMRSVDVGERLLQAGKTRSFGEFLAKTKKKKK